MNVFLVFFVGIVSLVFVWFVYNFFGGFGKCVLDIWFVFFNMKKIFIKIIIICIGYILVYDEFIYKLLRW